MIILKSKPKTRYDFDAVKLKIASLLTPIYKTLSKTLYHKFINLIQRDSNKLRILCRRGGEGKVSPRVDHI